MLPVLVAGVVLWMCLIGQAVNGEGTSALKDEFVRATVPPTYWKWTSCYEEGWMTTVGTYKNFGVLASGSNFLNADTILVVDLTNGSTIISKNLSSPIMLQSISYQVFPNGILLQTGWSAIAAWTLPDLQPLWSVVTFPLSAYVTTFSTTGRFFCLSLFESSSNPDSEYPSCFRMSDGSLLWTAFGNESLACIEFVESDGILVISCGVNSSVVTAIEIETGTCLWSAVSGTVTLAFDGIVVTETITSPVVTSGLNLRTGAVIWTRTNLYSFLTTVTPDGLALSPLGAFFVRNGTTAWTLPKNEAMCNGGVALPVSQPADGSPMTFLCSLFQTWNVSYTIGNALDGSFSPTTVVVMPADPGFFGAESGFFALASYRIGTSSFENCLHAVP